MVEMEDVHTPQETGNGATPWFKKRKFIFAGVVVVIAIGFLAYVGASQFATYYITVGEFVEEGDSLYDQRIRVAGNVVADSLDWDTDNFTLSFTLADGAAGHPILAGLEMQELQSRGSLYAVSPLGKSATPLLIVTIEVSELFLSLLKSATKVPPLIESASAPSYSQVSIAKLE